MISRLLCEAAGRFLFYCWLWVCVFSASLSHPQVGRPISPGESGLPAAGKGKWQKARTTMQLQRRPSPAISLSHRTASADSSLPHRPRGKSAHTPALCKLRSGCRSTNKDAMRRICRGSLPLQAEVQATLCNPSRPWSQPRDQLTRTARGSGGIACFDSPGGFPPISPGESGLPAAGKGKWQKARTHQAPPTVCQRQTPPSERRLKGMLRLGSHFLPGLGHARPPKKIRAKAVTDCYAL